MKKLKTHKEANYRAATTEKRCGGCSMFVSSKPPACTLVERPIRPSGVCDYYDPTNRKEVRRAA
jgi:hypothetical protein